MRNYLIFRLYGVMASWGNIAVGGVRPSHRCPSKSAIMGLLAAALGIKVEEEDHLQELQNSLGFAVRLDIEGQLLIDYHTAQMPSQQQLKNRLHYTRRQELMPSSLETVLSDREYYCDACYTIVLWQRNKNLNLFDLKNKLKKPSFILYLGRKSCPVSLPILPYLCETGTIEEALDYFDGDAISKKTIEIIKCLFEKNKNKGIRLYSDIDGQTKEQNYQLEIRRDQLFNRQRWQYSERKEKLILINKAED